MVADSHWFRESEERRESGRGRFATVVLLPPAQRGRKWWWRGFVEDEEEKGEAVGSEEKGLAGEERRRVRGATVVVWENENEIRFRGIEINTGSG
ncbi:hypothetical protein HAX54_025065 [Datura stramonium]|uniref:Uncharacterized protein n=1 Tax=Datura stramonium TaxID=4076 RepID=A0ABS8S5T6_DATST|nr:hypothetical protein [Datura stramonium]